VSRGLTRNRTDKLSVVGGSADPSPSSGEGVAARAATGGANVTAIGATALHTEPEAKLSPAQKLEFRAEAVPDAKADAKAKRAEAKAHGYEGDPCGECQNYTLVRNGTCMKCNTCGSTTGCS
jgi:ribonucleoside-diphosphate reductase alpha chain